MPTQEEIFNEIALAIVEVLPQDEKFQYVVLEIKRLPANIGFTGHYITSEGEKKWLDIFNFKLNIDLISNLYQITQTKQPIHSNWNRAKYMLFSENTVTIEYIWDQVLQDEVDKYNKENQDDEISYFEGGKIEVSEKFIQRMMYNRDVASLNSTYQRDLVKIIELLNNSHQLIYKTEIIKTKEEFVDKFLRDQYGFKTLDNELDH